jgi:hypothetical protein
METAYLILLGIVAGIYLILMMNFWIRKDVMPIRTALTYSPHVVITLVIILLIILTIEGKLFTTL